MSSEKARIKRGVVVFNTETKPETRELIRIEAAKDAKELGIVRLGMGQWLDRAIPEYLKLKRAHKRAQRKAQK